MSEAENHDFNWSNLIKYLCPKCSKKLHEKYTMGSISNQHGSYNRVIRCRSKNCDFVIWSDKLETVRGNILAAILA